MYDLAKIRKYLHKHPELSGKEKHTQKYLLKYLRQLSFTEIEKVAGTGILVCFKGEKEGGKVLLRADIDALPIQEENDNLDYKSVNEGVSHMCGHDGHATVMLGVARYFSENPPQKGEVHLLFQPAEETGSGAKKVLADPKMQKHTYNQVFAFHNLPGYEMGEIVCKTGTFSAGAISVAYKFSGKTSHAAEPEEGCNPAHAIAQCLMLSRELCKPDKKRDDFALITPVYATLGEQSYGVSAGYGEVHFTLRTWDNDHLTELEKILDDKVKAIVQKEGLELEYEWLEEFRPNKNSERAFNDVKSVAEELSFNFREITDPFKWGEDFGLFTQKFTGAMFGIGSGKDQSALHNPDFNFPDEIIETGIKMFAGLAERRMNHGEY